MKNTLWHNVISTIDRPVWLILPDGCNVPVHLVEYDPHTRQPVRCNVDTLHTVDLGTQPEGWCYHLEVLADRRERDSVDRLTDMFKGAEMTTKPKPIDATPKELEKAAEDVAPEKLTDPFDRLERRRRYYENAVKEGHKPTYAERSIDDLINAVMELRMRPQTAHGQAAPLGVSALATMDLLIKRVEALETSHMHAPVDHTIVNALQLRVDKLRDLIMTRMMDGEGK